MKKIAINGFGRIGRLIFRTLWGKEGIEIVSINDLSNTKTLAHLLKYDSAQCGWKVDSIKFGDGYIQIDGKKVNVHAKKAPSELPWGSEGIDLVVESTGFFTSKDLAEAHIQAGAKKVVISAPATGDLKTIVFNVNSDTLTSSDKIISAASCTTNCLAPVAKVLNDAFGIASGFMTTIHSYTNDQRVVDAAHSDLRRARAAATNIIPTSTGAAKAIGLVLPELKGKLDGTSLRVPTITGSIVDLSFTLEKETTIEEINKTLKSSANETLAYTEDEIVSSDVIGNTHGSIVDAKLTMKLGNGKDALYKVFCWYDNEMSYVNQLARTIIKFVKL